MAERTQQAWFLVGPSGAGKTRLIEGLEGLGLSAFDLDKLAIADRDDPRCWEAKVMDWDWATQALAALERDPTVIAVGAGTQNQPEAEAWLASRRERVLLIDADDARCCERKPRDLTDFVQLERAEHRRRLYALAAHAIDTTNMTEEAVLEGALAILTTAKEPDRADRAPGDRSRGGPAI